MFVVIDIGIENVSKSIQSIDACNLDWCIRNTISFLLRPDGFALGRIPLHDGHILDKHDLPFVVASDLI